MQMWKRMVWLGLLMALPLWCAVAKPRAKAPVRVACVGNSVTYGYGIPDRDSLSYPAQLARLLGKGFDVRNFGHSGATLLRKGHRPYMDLPEFRAALDFRPDWVVIHLGLNDTDPQNWPDHADEFTGDYAALVDSFRSVNPEVRVWVCQLTPIFHGHKRFDSSTRDWHADIRRLMPQVAQRTQSGLIDLYAPLHSRPDLFPDHLHPNAEGAGILAQTVWGALTGDYGGLQLSPWLTDGAVLRRNRTIYIKGMANAGEQVSVAFLGERRTAVAGADGKWQVCFPPHVAGGPFTLQASTASRHITLHDLWLGEVWLCSGQSNMEFPLAQARTAARDVAQAEDCRLLHFLDMKPLCTPYAEEWDSLRVDSINHLRYFPKATWQACHPQTAARFSAIAYHFGRVLSDSLQCPVGLVCNAVGGSTLESWVDRCTLEEHCPQLLQDWMNADYVMAWARNRARQNLARACMKHPRHPYEPCYLYETGIAPLEGMDLSGVLWYQGESNAQNALLHERMFPWFEQSWRHAFSSPELPFHVVQLSGLSTRPSWPRFRDGQRRLADTLPQTYLTVSSDVGDSLDVHPREKRIVGERLAASALARQYGYGITPAGPEVYAVVARESGVDVHFRWGKGLQAADGGEIQGFEVAGTDGCFHKAQACVLQASVANEEGVLRLTCAEVSCPVEVRYAWEAYPHANLVNADGLPAGTFRECVKRADKTEGLP